ncbi:GntR family transcriptional regulator [Leucobacter iarius]|uniref:GntR family transcriptional regulator n=1 Tax=Leucobacter iarius TaxID=333963 RepID=A0ABN2L7Y1_9MICO
MTETKPLHAQLYDAMIERIRTGEWVQGERVPSEKSLIAEFGTSRGPVRQALAALRAEGMIVGGRGAPPRVQRLVPSQSFETFLSFTEWANHLGYVPGQQVIEAARRPATEEIARDLQLTEGDPVVEIVRLRLLDGKPAMLERSLFPFWVGKHLLTADLDRGSIYQHLSALYITPVRARHTIDAVAAHQLDAEWLGVVPGNPLLRARRIAFDAHGALIEVADDRYLPSMATFVIENSAAHRTPITREPVGSSPEPREPVRPASLIKEHA